MLGQTAARAGVDEIVTDLGSARWWFSTVVVPLILAILVARLPQALRWSKGAFATLLQTRPEESGGRPASPPSRQSVSWSMATGFAVFGGFLGVAVGLAMAVATFGGVFISAQVVAGVALATVAVIAMPEGAASRRPRRAMGIAVAACCGLLLAVYALPPLGVGPPTEPAFLPQCWFLLASIAVAAFVDRAFFDPSAPLVAHVLAASLLGAAGFVAGGLISFFLLLVLGFLDWLGVPVLVSPDTAVAWMVAECGVVGALFGSALGEAWDANPSGRSPRALAARRTRM